MPLIKSKSFTKVLHDCRSLAVLELFYCLIFAYFLALCSVITLRSVARRRRDVYIVNFPRRPSLTVSDDCCTQANNPDCQWLWMSTGLFGHFVLFISIKPNNRVICSTGEFCFLPWQSGEFKRETSTTGRAVRKAEYYWNQAWFEFPTKFNRKFFAFVWINNECFQNVSGIILICTNKRFHLTSIGWIRVGFLALYLDALIQTEHAFPLWPIGQFNLIGCSRWLKATNFKAKPWSLKVMLFILKF